MIAFQGPYSRSYGWTPRPSRMGQVPATVTPVAEANEQKQAVSAITIGTMAVVALGMGILGYILGQMSAGRD